MPESLLDQNKNIVLGALQPVGMHASNERIDRQAAKQFELLRNLLKSSIRGLGNTFEFNLTTTSIRVIF